MTSRSRTLICISILLLASLSCSLFNRLASPPTATPEPTEQGAVPLPQEQEPTQPLPTVPPTQPAPSAVPEQPEPTAVPEQPLPPPPAGVRGPAFAAYPQIQVNLPPSFANDYSLPVDLKKVIGQDILTPTLTAPQQALLSQNGFVVLAPRVGKYREFYQVYESQRYGLDQPLFVTTDAVYHIYHLIFDKLLRDLERDHFGPDLGRLTSSMLAASAAQYQDVKGTPVEEPARRNLAFFAVAAQLLGLPEPVPAEVKDLVTAELALINAHGGPTASPIWDRPDLAPDKKLIEDYSQYIPRGHYTRSEALQRYFKAMMWYGRLTFRLSDAFETRRAVLMVQALRSAPAVEKKTATSLWENIYQPTTFIVGKSDDLSIYEYGALADQYFGAGFAPQAVADDARLAQFSQAAQKLPAPQVNSMWVWIWQDKKTATQGFRFMGQRFTLDEYVFGQLIWRNVGTIENPRGLPKALDFFAAMGSDEALTILNDLGENRYENYTTQMDMMRKEVAGLGPDSWTQNLYWNWLYALQPLLAPKDNHYPAFMRNPAWTRKDLQTAASSWSELKHDTLLYSKQVMAEMGGGGPSEPPHGYVEPAPEAYARLNALAQMTTDGLRQRGLLSDATLANIENLKALLTFLQSSAEKELNGQALSTDDYWRIQYFGGEIESMTIAASDCDSTDPARCRDLTDQKSPVVADVASGLAPDGKLAALEEGVGEPTEIVVVLPDHPWRLAVGAVYTYYEFPVLPENRMTDEQWQAMLAAGQNPPAPEWTQSFISP